MCASPYIQDKFDLGILRADGSTKVGLMLVRDKNNAPQFAVFDDEYLAAQYFSGEPGYGNLPSEKEMVMRQDDWRSGFGLEIYDSNNSKRYYSSIGMDMRFKGMAIAGPKSSTVTKPSSISAAATLQNTTFEAAANWTGGAQNLVTFHGGAASWQVDNSNAYQDAATWDVSWQSRTFDVWCFVWSAGANEARIAINDGVGTTYSSYHTGNSTWQTLHVQRTLDAAATRLRVLLYDDALGGGNSYFDDLVLGSPVAGITVKWADFNDAWYMASGQILSKLNGTGDTFTIVAAMPAVITDIEPFTDSRLYIALGTSNPYMYMNTSEVITDTTNAGITNNKYQYFKTVHSATPNLWGNDGVNTIRSCTNPIIGGAAWSGQTTVSSSYNSITGLFSTSGALYIGKEDMMYYLNSAGAVQNDLAPELQSLTSSTSCKNSIVWLGALYIPAGSQSLLENDSGTNTWLSPALYITNLGDFNGQVQALAADDQYLFAILDNSTKIEVLAGRHETIDGVTSWVWHPINETTLTGCQTAAVSSVYQKRLWIASTAAGDSIYYIPLPTGYGNITADANRSFQTGTTMETPWLHGNFKATTKAYPKLELTMGHTYNTGRYFTAKYKKLGDSAWTTIGNYTGSATSMTQSRYIPADASSNNPKATMFKLQFTAVTDDTTITPVLLSYHLTGILYPTQREIIACKVRCSNEIVLRDGTVDNGSAATIAATLDEARTATWPVTIYDLDGTAVTVKFLAPSSVPRWQVTKRESGRKEEREYNLLMQRISLS